MNIANHKKTILIIIALLLAFFGYWYFFISKKDTSTKNTGQIKSTNAKSGPVAPDGLYSKEFVASLVGFNSVKLDVTIFELNEFKALNYPEKPFDINYSKDAGRDNPFLPIGIESQTPDTSPIQQQNPVQNPAPVSTSSRINSIPPGMGLPPVSSTTNRSLAPTLPPTPKPKTF